MASPSSKHFLSLVLIFFLTLHALTAAQTVLDSSKLPSCYTKCTPLEQANSACVPPAAPATAQGTYQDCFCQSQLLTNLHSTSSGLCDSAGCSPSDLQQIFQWYTTLCTAGIIVTPSAATQTTPSTSTIVTQAGGTTTTGAASSQTSGVSVPVRAKQSSGGWFSTHWKWILLLIILFFAFVVFLGGGLWLKRYLRRRRDKKRFSGSGQLRTANSPSPFASGALAPSDGAYIGSRNHPPMSAVPDTRSAAAMDRYGSASNLGHGGYGSQASRDLIVPNPPPQSASATRNLPWVAGRVASGGSRRGRQVSPLDEDTIVADGEGRGRKSKDGSSLRQKISRKSKSRSRKRRSGPRDVSPL